MSPAEAAVGRCVVRWWDDDAQVWTSRPHGSPARYRYGPVGYDSGRGCRCDVCVTEMRARYRKWNQARRNPPPVERGPDMSWLEDAACRGVDPALFFPERGASTREAKAICAECPVREQCRDYALDTNQKHGIWGGLSERERRRIRSKRFREAS